jgi:hypothetical protein
MTDTPMRLFEAERQGELHPLEVMQVPVVALDLVEVN